MLYRALTHDEVLQDRVVKIEETDDLLRYSGSDARKLLNIVDLLASSAMDTIVINDEVVSKRLQQNPLAYDKDGEMHYDIISAFIKSMRGSNPDAAVYWMARMIEGGESPEFIARRMVICAAEDVGLANPNALLIANAAFDTVHKIGWPEARIPLAEAAIYIANSPKSNSAYCAIDAAIAEVKRSGNLAVPLHLRNAPTRMMKDLGYGKGYRYPHDFPNNFVTQDYLPEALKDTQFWQHQQNRQEEQQYERWKYLWEKE